MRAKLVAALSVLTFAAASAVAGVAEEIKLPILSAETETGSIVATAAANVAPTPKVVDGDASDWTGQSTRLGGTAIYSHGELVYQDFLNDAWGADDGFDADRKATLDTVKAVEPRTYRADVLQQAAGAQFGADRPVGAELHYGDTAASAGTREQADIEEARVAADATRLYFMVRTLAMATTPATAVLILIDTAPGIGYVLPASMGGITTSAEWAFVVDGDELLAAAREGMGLIIGCQDPCISPVTVASNPAGFTNTIEVGIDRDLISDLPQTPGVMIATGIAGANGFAATKQGDAKSDLINVAFRREPARIWMDENQAFALREGSIELFKKPVDLNRLQSGATETFTQRPGYYEAIYVDHATPVNREETTNAYFQGPYQHYGVYLPKTYRPGNTHAGMFWMHYRGGHAHDAAAWEPAILRDFGDGGDAIVVTPSARGESSWYTGRGMVDFLDAWDDAHARWNIDDDRTYLGGHSMGGWASWLLGLLMPDRWAASNPQDGLLVPGLWTGAGAPTGPQNGADIQAEFLYPLLENARNLPYAILHGTADELVPVTGAIAAGQRLHELGYRYRTYLYHAYEHYSAPIWDDWREMQSYMWSHRRDRSPSRVTFKVSPALNHAVSTISVPSGVDLGFNFNSAYWVSGLAVREPGIDPSNIGTFDALNSAVDEDLGTAAEAGAGVWGPYTMHGQRWTSKYPYGRGNRIMMWLDNIATATLDLSAMMISTSLPINVHVNTDGPVLLSLRGTWAAVPDVTEYGASVISFDGTTLVVRVEAGDTNGVLITP